MSRREFCHRLMQWRSTLRLYGIICIMLMFAACTTQPTGRIAYVTRDEATRHLMLWEAGEVRRIAEGRMVQVVWSPEGERIAFTRVDDSFGAGRVSLWVLEVATGHEVLLRANAGRRIEPIWAPDGESIAYVAQLGTERDLVWQSTSPPYAVTPLTTDGRVYGRPTWSPDGERIAFLSRQPNLYSAVETIRMDGSERTMLLTSPLYKREPAWSPDGSRIAVILGQSIVTLDPAGGPPYEVVTTPMDTIATLLWAPDGSVLYYSNVPGTQQARVWAVTAGGTVREEIAQVDDGLAGVSPDGRYLLTAGELCLIEVSRPDRPANCLGLDGHTSYLPVWGP